MSDTERIELLQEMVVKLGDALEQAKAELQIALKTSRQFLSDSEWKALQSALHRKGRTKL